MSQGDVQVCGVSSDIVIEDISFNVPRQTATLVPGEKAMSSRDLWTLVNQGKLFLLKTSPAVRQAIIQESHDVAVKTSNSSPEASQLRELEALRKSLSLEQEKLSEALGFQARLREDLELLRTSNVSLTRERDSLLTEVTQLRVLLVEEKGRLDQLGKLDDILNLLQKQPRNAISLPSQQVSSSELASDEEAPKFIPSQIKSDTPVENAVQVQSTQSSGGSVSSAARALRDQRKKQ